MGLFGLQSFASQGFLIRTAPHEPKGSLGAMPIKNPWLAKMTAYALCTF